MYIELSYKKYELACWSKDKKCKKKFTEVIVCLRIEQNVDLNGKKNRNNFFVSQSINSIVINGPPVHRSSITFYGGVAFNRIIFKSIEVKKILTLQTKYLLTLNEIN